MSGLDNRREPREARWLSFTDREIACLVSSAGVSYSEGIGGSGDRQSDRELHEQLAAEYRRRGLSGNDYDHWTRDGEQ